MADDDEMTLVATVTGREEHLSQFVELCKTMHLLGSAGASRTIEVHYDGDGAARLRFDFGETDVDDIVVPESVMDEDLIYIGFG